MEKIRELSHIIMTFRKENREAENDLVEVHVGEDCFYQIVDEYEQNLIVTITPDKFHICGTELFKNENLEPFEVVLVTKKDIKQLPYDKFLEHKHNLHK